mmetsp:Transcript_104893/g.181251  ORF Transcript_104893/g.181251 Transcript_104893/m.181251 type:complete len:175 (+) Transcript_104893:91-615(+)
MRSVAIVLLCLACAGHAQKVEDTKALATLLQALNPDAAFQPTGALAPNLRPKASQRQTIRGQSSPLMSINDQDGRKMMTAAVAAAVALAPLVALAEGEQASAAVAEAAPAAAAKVAEVVGEFGFVDLLTNALKPWALYYLMIAIVRFYQYIVVPNLFKEEPIIIGGPPPEEASA